MSIRESIKKIMPITIFLLLRPIFQCWYVLYSFFYDYIRYLRYSSSLNYSTPTKLEGSIIMKYHVIEKGLTMPKTRLGFGKERIPVLCNFCDKYISKYNLSESKQVQHAIGVLKEYIKFHEKNKFNLSDKIKNRIDKTIQLADKYEKVAETKQFLVTKEEYFKHINAPFTTFSNSRRSVRNYSEQNIPIEVIEKTINLVINTPSACNRQTSRAYVFINKEKIKTITDIQGGAGGFGYLANKLIVITAELGVFGGAHERYQAYIDGGMFAMNMLYALHSNSIVCCILNCSNSPEKDKKLQKCCKIKKNEVFIAMISCGYAPDKFSVATSYRYKEKDICKIIQN